MYFFRGAQWQIDEKWLRAHGGKLMVHTPSLQEEAEEIKRRIKFTPDRRVVNTMPAEKTVRNMELNFGPQHPAAHGVLRLVSAGRRVGLIPKIYKIYIYIFGFRGYSMKLVLLMMD